MLSEEQKVTKWKAIAETAKYTAEKNDKKYFDYIKNGNLRDARRMRQKKVLSLCTASKALMMALI